MPPAFGGIDHESNHPVENRGRRRTEVPHGEGRDRLRGVSVQAFSSRFRSSPEDLYGEIPGWIDEGFLEQRDGRLKLTPRGLQVADSLFTSFV